MRVLIADDDGVAIAALEGMLIKRGYEVVVAENGDAAWAILEGDEPPQLVILDWMMPGLNGDAVCRRIRGTPRLECTYVILLSSRDTQGAILAGLRAGADDYVTKPFIAGELEARIAIGAKFVRVLAQRDERIRELESALLGLTGVAE